MGKYIITFEDYPQMEEDGVKFYSCNEAPWWYASEQIISKLTPYTEPDTEQVREEAYEDGYKTAKVQCNIQAEKDLREVGKRHYQKGLSDAWEAARKIFEYSATTLKKIFSKCCYSVVRDILRKYSASEVIEKIRQYEESKEKHTWICSEVNEPSVDTTLICSECGYAIKIKPHETPKLNFCPKCGDCKKPKEEET